MNANFADRCHIGDQLLERFILVRNIFVELGAVANQEEMRLAVPVRERHRQRHDVLKVVAERVAQQSAIRSMQSAMTAKDLTDVETRDVDTGAAPAAEPLRADDLVGMRAVGVTPEYVEKLREHGGSMDPDDIIAAKATGVDPAYIGSMRAILPGADFGDLVGAKQVGIDAAFARDMKEHFPGVDLDDLIALKAMGVDCDFVTDMRKAGVRLRDPDDAIELRATGMHPRGRGAKRSIVSKDGATVRFGPGPVIEARSADGRVARIEVPEAPAATRPPVPPAPPGT